MDAMFGLLSLTDAPLSTDCATACDAFAATQQGRVTRWSDGGVQLVCAERVSRRRTTASSRLAVSPSGRYRMALAGALHYRVDLARRLDLGPNAATLDEMGDALLAAHAWEKWQDAAPPYLEGEFCLAIVDVRERSVTLVQSRIEYAPLYYAETPAWLGFSTHMLPLTRVPGVGRGLDPVGVARAVSHYQLRSNDPRRTCARGVERMPTAHARRRGRMTKRAWDYWAPDPEAVTAYRSEEEVHQEIHARVRAGVVERTRNEAIVACLLSGGLDSSTLACLAAQGAADRRAVVGIAAVADGSARNDEADERPHIECVQRHTGIDVALVTPAADVNPWRVPDRFFMACESPSLSPRHYLYDALFSAAAGRGAGLVLDGGYGELGPSFHAWLSPLARARQSGIRGAIRAAGRRLRGGPRHNSERYGTVACGVFTPWMYAAVRDDFLRDSGLAREMTGSGPPRWQPASNPRARIGYNPLWRKIANSAVQARGWHVESTYPFADPRLWQYCAGLPSGLALRNGHNRYLVRAAMDGVLPPAIQWRTTKGAFSSDYYARLQRNLEWVRTLFVSVAAHETAAQLIDVPWMRSTLAAISPADLCRENIALVFLLQGTATAVQYLRWFERTGQPAAQPTYSASLIRSPARTGPFRRFSRGG